MLMIIILVILILLVIIRRSNNDDIINNNAKYESDIANITNAKKVFRKSKTANYMFIATLLILIILMACNFTKIDYLILDYISADFVEEPKFDYLLYFIPAYIAVVREIFIQVKIGEFLLKYFQVEEDELDINNEVIKPILKKTKIMKK